VSTQVNHDLRDCPMLRYVTTCSEPDSDSGRCQRCEGCRARQELEMMLRRTRREAAALAVEEIAVRAFDVAQTIKGRVK
jgi:hypothetical protein